MVSARHRDTEGDGHALGVVPCADCLGTGDCPCPDCQAAEVEDRSACVTCLGLGLLLEAAP